VARLVEQTDRIGKDITSIQLPKLTGRDEESFQLESSETSMSLESKNRKLGILESRLVDKNSPESVQELMLEVAELAERTDVRIEQSLPGILDHPKLNPLGNGIVIGSVYRRPLRRLELVGTFYGIRDFILGLETLPEMATVLRFSMRQARGATNERGRLRYLQAELLVAF
jgi:hypothetical protein